MSLAEQGDIDGISGDCRTARWRPACASRMAGVIPALSDLSAEGSSYDEAIHNARHAAEVFLSRVRVTTIELGIPLDTFVAVAPEPC
jgi:predicted RNase H-like HicB family nuclease